MFNRLSFNRITLNRIISNHASQDMYWYVDGDEQCHPIKQESNYHEIEIIWSVVIIHKTMVL